MTEKALTKQQCTIDDGRPSDGMGQPQGATVGVTPVTSDAPLTSNEQGFLPCPFCGVSPNSHSYSFGGKSYAWVECDQCRIRKELRTDGGSLEMQIFAMNAVTRWWNRRVVSGDSSAPETSCQHGTYHFVGTDVGLLAICKRCGANDKARNMPAGSPVETTEQPALGETCPQHGWYRLNAAGCPVCHHEKQQAHSSGKAGDEFQDEPGDGLGIWRHNL